MGSEERLLKPENIGPANPDLCSCCLVHCCMACKPALLRLALSAGILGRLDPGARLSGLTDHHSSSSSARFSRKQEATHRSSQLASPRPTDDQHHHQQILQSALQGRQQPHQCQQPYSQQHLYGDSAHQRAVFPPQQQVRRLHLAPPFLVEDYTPAAVTTYRLGRMPAKLQAAQAELEDCRACPRNCGVNR